ncbi:MAG TPA: DUF2269 family protein [Acidimicrobiia bacterium]|nr:DUF2269 family protein [Acidimicrobiia bacterium]
MLIVGAYYDGFYKFVLVLHILCAIIGFGAVFLNMVYSLEMRKHPGPGGLAIFDANFRVSEIAQYFIVAVFVLGCALVGLSDSVIEFSQTWIWLAMLLFVIAFGISHGVLRPALKRMRVLMGEMQENPPSMEGGVMPPQVTEMIGLAKRIAPTGLILDLFLIAILCLMVWRPGF